MRLSKFIDKMADIKSLVNHIGTTNILDISTYNNSSLYLFSLGFWRDNSSASKSQTNLSEDEMRFIFL